MNVTKLIDRITRLHSLYHSGAIPTLAQHEVHPDLPLGSRENYIYFTLPPCINFQRSSPAMWTSAHATFNDPDTNYLFSPEEVIKKDRNVIQKDLLKHKLALQLNKHTDIWITISKTFHDYYNGDPRELLKQADWDVIKIHDIIQNTQKAQFPYLSGPKMSNYWLYILSQYTDAQFMNMHEISIIPDTHVLQCSIHLGISQPTDSPLKVAQLWKDLLQESTISPVQMHPVLWNWSRNNFKPEV